MDSSYSELYQSVLNLCYKIYNPGVKFKNIFLFRQRSLNFIIKFLEENRLEHYFALENYKKYERNDRLENYLQNLVFEYKEYESNLKKYFIAIRDILKNRDFLVIKTISVYPHTTSDVDILVRDVDSLATLSGGLKQLNIGFNPPIDISTTISWGGVYPIEKDFIWNNRTDYSFSGVDIYIPNQELDILIRLAHVPFELAQLRLGELLHIFKQSAGIDWKILEYEAEKNRWPKTFNKIKVLLQRIHIFLFGIPFFKDETINDYQSIYDFPFQVPFSLLLSAVIEKRAWNKVWGGRFIVKDRITKWLKKGFH